MQFSWRKVEQRRFNFFFFAEKKKKKTKRPIFKARRRLGLDALAHGARPRWHRSHASWRCCIQSFRCGWLDTHGAGRRYHVDTVSAFDTACDAIQMSAHPRHRESAIRNALPERLKLHVAGLCGNAASSDALSLLSCALAAAFLELFASLTGQWGALKVGPATRPNPRRWV